MSNSISPLLFLNNLASTTALAVYAILRTKDYHHDPVVLAVLFLVWMFWKVVWGYVIQWLRYVDRRSKHYVEFMSEVGMGLSLFIATLTSQYLIIAAIDYISGNAIGTAESLVLVLAAILILPALYVVYKASVIHPSDEPAPPSRKSKHRS